MENHFVCLLWIAIVNTFLLGAGTRARLELGLCDNNHGSNARFGASLPKGLSTGHCRLLLNPQFPAEKLCYNAPCPKHGGGRIVLES